MEEQNPPPQLLERRYTWEELANLFADRIETNGFLTNKDYNRRHFIRWFMKREKVGLRFDWRLVARCYKICRDLDREFDHFTVIVGGEGTGKSTLAAQYSAWIAPSTSIEDINYDMPQYITRMQSVAKNFAKNKRENIDRSLIIDEGGINLFSRESLKTSNIVLAKTFMVQRFLNVSVTICIPYYWGLDSLIRNHRINTLIYIKKRGSYKVYVGNGIKILNRLGAKDKDKPLVMIPVPYGLFWEGNFRKHFPDTINKEIYDKHKFNHIRTFIDDARREASTVKMIKVKNLEKEFGISSEALIKQIENGKIEGRQIGKHWFITKKAYDKLTMVK